MRVLHRCGPDDYLTPPGLVAALGPFYVDPCCHPWMPWRTAAAMHSLHPEAWADANVDTATGERPAPPLEPPPGTLYCPDGSFHKPQWGDGLLAEWRGRVWLNQPYSDSAPWVERLLEHGRGTMLCTPKAADTAWFQRALRGCSRALFLAGRIAFHLPTGERTKGKWLPNCLLAFGGEDGLALERLLAPGSHYRGVLMARR